MPYYNFLSYLPIISLPLFPVLGLQYLDDWWVNRTLDLIISLYLNLSLPCHRSILGIWHFYILSNGSIKVSFIWSIHPLIRFFSCLFYPPSSLMWYFNTSPPFLDIVVQRNVTRDYYPRHFIDMRFEVIFCAIGSITIDYMFLPFPFVIMTKSLFSCICANKSAVSFKYIVNFQKIRNALTHIILRFLVVSSKWENILFTLYLNVGSDVQYFFNRLSCYNLTE